MIVSFAIKIHGMKPTVVVIRVGSSAQSRRSWDSC
jgi:hypothetical protein